MKLESLLSASSPVLAIRAVGRASPTLFPRTVTRMFALTLIAAPLSGCFGALFEDEASKRPSDPPLRATEPVIRVAADRTCVVERSGRVRCAGSDRNGKLGGQCKDTCEDVDGTYACCLSPTEIPSLGDVADLALGDDHACAVRRDGSVVCWGANEHGQLGAAPSAGGPAPHVVPSLSDVRQIVAGRRHSCALNGDGATKCWGQNETGQLGDGTTTDDFVPRSVRGLRGVRHLAASWDVSCAVLEDGKAWCWGSNDLRDLGPWWRCTQPTRSGSGLACTSPREVPDVSGVSYVTASGCAIANGDLVCWDGGGVLEDRTARAVSSYGRVVLFDRSSNHECAMDDRGTVRCSLRTLADLFSTSGPKAPEVIAGVEHVRQLAVGAGHACALLGDDGVRCWGANANGQLGSGSAAPESSSTVVSW